VTVDIVDVHIVGQRLESGESLEALGSDLRGPSGELSLALVVSNGLVKSVVIQTVPIPHLNVSWSSVEVPVGASISDHEPFEVQLCV
jgi:hypothetical protein